MITDEMVEKAFRAFGAKPVGAGDGDTFVVPAVSKAGVRAALEAVAPMIAKEEAVACAVIAQHKSRDIQLGAEMGVMGPIKAAGTMEVASDIATAILARHKG